MTSSFNHGEDVASEFIEKLLIDGGKTLYDHYLDKKSFPFAADAVSDGLVAQMRCTFVPHEEKQDEGGGDDCWDMELEPEPNSIDTWARMYVPKRLRVVRAQTEGSTLGAGGAPSDVGLRSKTKEKGATAKGKKDNLEETLKNRSSKLTEVFEDDPEGDMLRDFKAAEEKKKRDEDLKAKRAAEKRSEELKKLEAQHEEMRRRNFAYDSEGNIVWVDPPNMEKLPKICEVCPYKQQLDKGAAPPRTNEGDKASPKKGQQKSDKKKKKGDEAFAFTDGFTRLATQQPPVIDTLVPKAGVLLEHKGRKKKGPPLENPEGSMTREEYKQLTENEDATGGGGGQQASAAGKAIASPNSTQKFEEQGSSEPLPPLKESAGGSARGASGAAFSDLAPAGGVVPGGASPQSGADQGSQRRRLPIAPQPNYKNKLESIGHLPRAPRQHMGPLGQVFGNGRFPQPPMGATMGHGLMRARANSSREFYFPNVRDAPPLYETMGTSPTNLNSLSRTQSERSFPTPRTGFEPTQDPYIWRLGPPAKIQTNTNSGGYKNFRAALANVVASP